MWNRRLTSLGPLATMLLAIVLSACGASAPATPAAGSAPAADTSAAAAQSSAADAAASTETAPDASAAAPASTKGGDLVIAYDIDTEPDQLDGQVDANQAAWMIDLFATDHLIFRTPEGEIEPWLATEWETSDDNLSYTFTLREDVTFQDGTPFNALALKYNIERILDPKTASAQAANELGAITAVEVLGEYQLKVSYDEPWSTLLDAFTSIPIWSPEALAKYPPGEFDKYLVGTGPFKLVEWVPTSYIRFEKWPDYNWGPSIKTEPGPVYLDSVTIKFVGEDSVLGTIITTDEANAVYEVPAQYMADYKDDPNYQTIIGYQSGTGLQYIMNTTRPPLSDIRVRKALRHAVDPVALNDLVYEGLYLPMYGPLDSVHPCYWDGAEGYYPYDPEQAKAMLEEAGWSDGDGDGVREATGVQGVADGTPLNLAWYGLSRQELGEALQAQLKQVGVGMTIEIIPGAVQQEKSQNKDFDLMYERQRSPDPNILNMLWNSENDIPGGWAWTGFADPKLDGILNNMQSVLDPDERCELARQAQEIIMENALQLPTLSQPSFYVLKSEVKDWQAGSEGNWYYVYNTYIDAE